MGNPDPGSISRDFLYDTSYKHVRLRHIYGATPSSSSYRAGQCGTCVVKVTSPSWGLRSEYEADKILKGRKFGESEEYRLACQTIVERGEATVVVRPPKKGK